MSALAIVLSGVWMAAAVWLIQQPPPFSLSPALELIAAMALVQEAVSQRGRGFGLFSTAPSCYLALCLLPGGGPRVALMTALISIALRTFFKGDPEWAVRHLEALADLLPITGVLVFWQLSGPHVDAWMDHPLGVALWLGLFAGLTWFIPMWLASTTMEAQLRNWNQFRLMILLPLLATVCLGPALALVAQLGALYPLLLVPALWGIRQAAANQSARLDNVEVDQLQIEYRTSKRALRRSAEELDQTARQLEQGVREREVLEQLTRTLVHSRTIRDSVRTVGQAILDLVRADSVVVYVSQVDGEQSRDLELRPAWCISPHRARLESATGHEPLEPVVERCFQSQVPVARSARDASHWFPGESWGLAMPLEDQGVVYLGRQNAVELTEEERNWLFIVTSQAALGLKSARRFSSLQEALHSQEVANVALHRWVERLTVLLDGARRLSESLDLTELLNLTQGLLVPLIPHDGGWLLWGGELRSRWPQSFGAGQSWDAMLAAAVDHQGTLMVADLSIDPPPGGQPASGSLMVAPLWTSKGPEGALMLWSARPGNFDPEQKNLLNLVALHLAAALSSASMHLKVMETQAQMVQSSKLAAVGQLAAGIAHELNSPLGAVVLQLDAAQMRIEKRPELVPEKLKLAMEGIQKCQAIISKLLYYSREGSVLMQPVDLNQVVNDTLQLSRAQIEVEGVTVITKLQSEGKAFGNQNELQQVLTNLLINARDAARKAEDRRILAQTGSDARHVWLRITDLGEGVPMEIQERIFEPFFTTKEVGEGTGLGLYVSLEIVGRHNGKLELEESSGRRTTFLLQLPRHQEEA